MGAGASAGGAAAAAPPEQRTPLNLSDSQLEQHVRDLYRLDRNRLAEMLAVANQVVQDERSKGTSNHMVSNMVHQEYSRKVRDVYKVSREQLGLGMTGVVIKVQHRQTGVQYAMKSFRVGKGKDQGKDQLRNEIAIMSQLDHPNIVRLVEAFYTDTHVHLIMELCSGGELYQHLIDHNRYNEREAKRFVRKILLATAYLHMNGVVHGDLKLENILFDGSADGTEAEAELKVCDFGLSQHLEPGRHLHALAGTPYYMAPEVLDGDYEEKCDVWSIGVIAYMLLSGTPPFPGNSQDEIFDRVRTGEVDMTGRRWELISPAAKEFITAMLQVNPTNRPSCAQCLEHPWMTTDSEEYDATHEPVLDNVVNNLMQFIQFSALKRLALEVVSFTLAPDQVRAMRTEFLKFDVNSTGVITVNEFRQALSGMQGLSAGDIDDVFNKIDIDHSGQISWHEFLAAAIDTSSISECHLKEAFAHLDTERNGKITKQDIINIMGEDMNATEVDEMFDELKTKNGKEALDCSDFIKICRTNSYRGVGPTSPVASLRRRTQIDPSLVIPEQS